MDKKLNTNTLGHIQDKGSIQEKIDKALGCLNAYYLKGKDVISLIEKKDYEGIDDILKTRDSLFYNFKTMEFILKNEGVDLSKEKIDGIEIESLVLRIKDINDIIQNNTSKILAYYRNNLFKLSCSLKYIKKAKHTRKESNFRKEV